LLRVYFAGAAPAREIGTDVIAMPIREQVPHFDVNTIDGRRVRYSELWQHRNLVLVLINADDRRARSYIQALQAHAGDFLVRETALVITSEPVTGFRTPTVVVADRWGEIVHETVAPEASMLPSGEDLLEWVNFVQIQCPECPP
jgi:hypothetical protein